MKIQERFKQKKNQNAVIIILAIILLVVLGREIPKFCTVCGLPDEAGYIFNAAYFLKYDWSGVGASMPYYAYGYSVFLIPLFMLCKTGVELIRSAIAFNLICLVVLYLLQIYIIRKIYTQSNLVCLAIISFITCFSPYLVDLAFSVCPEVLLTLWVWVVVFFLYQALRSNKLAYYCILAFFSAYIFFIHTRAIVIAGTVYLTLLLIGVRFHKKEVLKKMIVSVFLMAVFFRILYLVKESILNYTASLQVAKGDEVITANLLTTDSIKNMLKGFFDPQNIRNYLLGGAARFFYIAYATGDMVWYSILSLFRSICDKTVGKDSDKEIAVYGVKFFFLLSAVFMVSACVIASYGINTAWTYCFYGRYYEFTIIPLMCIGCCDYLYGKQSYIKDICIIIAILFMGLATMYISGFLDNEELYIDTGRAAGFTSAIKLNNTYRPMILYAALILVLLIILRSIQIKSFNTKWIYLLVIFAFILKSDIPNISNILNAHNGAKGDTELAEIIMEQPMEQDVYMLDTPYRWTAFYSRMQVLIKNKTLNIVSPNALEEVPIGSYILTYYDANLEEMQNELEYCQKGSIFVLYKRK